MRFPVTALVSRVGGTKKFPKQSVVSWLRSFTLIELIVVIVIIGILAAIALVAFNSFVYNAHQSAAEQSAAQLSKLIQAESGFTQIAPPAVTAARVPTGAQVPFAGLTYGADIPADISSFAIDGAGSLSVVTSDGFLCSAGVFSSAAGSSPTGSYSCSDAEVAGIPSGLTATPGNSAVTLAWSAGGGVVDDYEVSYSPDGTTWTVFPDGVTSVTGAVVTGLTNGTPYTFSVVATNLVGPSAALTATATPFTNPGAPTGVTAVPGPGEVTISWGEPASDGGSPIQSYQVSAAPGGAQCTAVAPALSCVISGLGTDNFSFTVTASNGLGSSASSLPATATPFSNAQGGTVAEVANYNGTGETWRVHTFTANGTFTLPADAENLSVLVVAGGGASNAGGQSGGGGGGVISSASLSLASGAYPVSVGAAQSSSDAFGFTAAAGGRGGAFSAVGEDGGSGGGGGKSSLPTDTYFGKSAGYGTPTQGHDGSYGSQDNGNNGGGGGGGGAGSVGVPFPNVFAGNLKGGGGGAGAVSSITGSAVEYAPGGSGWGIAGSAVRLGTWGGPGSGGGIEGVASAGVVIVAYRVS